MASHSWVPMPLDGTQHTLRAAPPMWHCGYCHGLHMQSYQRPCCRALCDWPFEAFFPFWPFEGLGVLVPHLGDLKLSIVFDFGHNWWAG